MPESIGGSLLTRLSVASCCVLLGGVATPSWGQVTALAIESEECPGEVLPGFITNRLSIDFEGQLYGQQLVVELTSGTIYQDVFGTSGEPSPALMATFPSLACDSYVAIGDVHQPDDPWVSPDGILLIDNEELPAVWNVGWGPGVGAVFVDQMDVFVAQVTLSDNAEGAWWYLASAGNQRYVIENGVISGGVMSVPEASAATIASAGLLAGAWRRRD